MMQLSVHCEKIILYGTMMFPHTEMRCLVHTVIIMTMEYYIGSIHLCFSIVIYGNTLFSEHNTYTIMVTYESVK